MFSKNFYMYNVLEKYLPNTQRMERFAANQYSVYLN